jgi:hypothetical protein
MATQITFDGTMDHLSKNLMLSFSFTNDPSIARICDSTVFNLDYVQICTSLTTELITPHATKVLSHSDVFAFPVSTKTIDSAIQPKYTDACTNEPITCKIRYHDPSNCHLAAEYPHASCVVTSTATMATQITFDGTIEHLSENLMLSFEFTNDASILPICDSTVFNLNYEHVGCTSFYFPNDTKTHK